MQRAPRTCALDWNCAIVDVTATAVRRPGNRDTYHKNVDGQRTIPKSETKGVFHSLRDAAWQTDCGDPNTPVSQEKRMGLSPRHNQGWTPAKACIVAILQTLSLYSAFSFFELKDNVRGNSVE